MSLLIAVSLFSVNCLRILQALPFNEPGGIGTLWQNACLKNVKLPLPLFPSHLIFLCSDVKSSWVKSGMALWYWNMDNMHKHNFLQVRMSPLMGPQFLQLHTTNASREAICFHYSYHFTAIIRDHWSWDYKHWAAFWYKTTRRTAPSYSQTWVI